MAGRAITVVITLLSFLTSTPASSLDFGNFNWNGVNNSMWSDALVLRLGSIFDHDVDPAFASTRKELLISLSLSLQLCKDNFEVASQKINEIADIYVPNYDIDYDHVKDLLNQEESDITKDLLDHFDFEEKVLLDQPNYIKDLASIINTLNRACSSLPSVFPQNLNRRPRSPEKLAQRLALGLTKWAKKWLDTIERKLEHFITNCTANNNCKDTLERFIKLMVESLKEKNNYLGVDAWKELQETIQTLSHKGPPHMDTLSSLQRAVLQMEPDIGELEEEQSFAMAAGVSKVKDIDSLVDKTNNIHKGFNLLTNLFRFGSKEKARKVEEAKEIEIETNKLLTKVPPYFLSVAFGSSLIQENWGLIKDNLPRFIKIASALSPAMVRVGGSAANFLTFDPSRDPVRAEDLLEDLKSPSKDHPKMFKYNVAPTNEFISFGEYSNHPKRTNTQFRVERNDIEFTDHMKGGFSECDPQLELEKDYKNFTMTGNDWKFLTDMVQELNWTLLFDLNQFWRDPSGNWDPTNAKLLFNDPETAKVPIIWQLGNEPNAYHHKFNWSVTPHQAAEDFKTLRQVLRSEGVLGGGSNPAQVVGPDVTRPKHLEGTEDESLTEDSMEFLRGFLEEGKEQIDALTWHQYYMSGHDATVDKFLSPEILNKFSKQLAQVVSIGKELAPGKPIWLTETASAWSGGAPALSDRAVGAFPWLDKLGLAASGGASAVFRQTFYGGCYSLLNHDLNPNPDFWASVLYNKLVGEGVLLTRTRLAPETVRVYSYCMNPNHQLYKKGAVVIMGINLSDFAEQFNLVGENFKKSSKLAYVLCPPQGNLKSRHLWLNGQTLKLKPNGDLPDMIPWADPRDGLEFIPWTMTFWVFREANASEC